MAVELQTKADSGPDLLTHWTAKPDSRTLLRDGIASIAVNLLLIGGMVAVAEAPGSVALPPPRFARPVHQVVRIVAPPKQLTQKDPNPGKAAKEVNVEALQARPEIRQHVPQPPRRFQPPAPVASAPPAPLNKPPVLTPEPPKVEATSRVPDNVPAQLGNPQAPPPKPQPEQPKIALESPGQDGSLPRSPGQMRIPIPKTSVDDAVRSVIHGGGQGGGMTVGDDDQMPLPSDPLRQTPSPGRVQSSLQLLSDPLGADFKPYLIRVLSLVRRNWLAIIPESARMGRPGLVQLKFVVSKDGSVPKLVIAMPSGTEAFDRAAVAGVTASLPFPPLPTDFKGTQVVLQFSFTYNLKPGRR